MTIIAAPAGFRLVQALGSVPKTISETVLAFRFDADSYCPIPITPTGSPDPERPWLLIHPDGHLSSGCYQFGSFTEWLRDTGLEG